MSSSFRYGHFDHTATMLAPYLALRYLRRRRAAWLSVAAVMLTVMVPVVVIGIMQGWVQVTQQQVRGAEADLTVRSFSRWQGIAADRWQVAERLAEVPGVAAVAPFVYGEAVIQHVDVARKTIFSLVDGVDLDQEFALGRLQPESLHQRPALNLSAAP